MAASGERPLSQILDCRRITIRAVLRGQSRKYCIKSVVFLDSDAHNFGARVFDGCDVHVSLLQAIQTSLSLAHAPSNWTGLVETTPQRSESSAAGF